jgi:DNA mismatch repair protein MutL
VLWFTLPTHEVDVNVHPQKHEVRFRDERSIQEMVFKAVREALYVKRQEAPPASLQMALPPRWELPLQKAPLQEEALSLPLPPSKPLPGRVLAALKGYLLAEVPGEEGVQLIDQERALARVVYERLLKSIQGSVAQVPLLIPYTLSVSKLDAALLKDHLEVLNTLGFEIREFGVDTFAIEAYPEACEGEALEEMILSFLEDFRSGRKGSLLHEKIAERSAGFACRKKRTLTQVEGQRLIEDLHECEEPGISPSGKPVKVQLDAKTLAKHF